MPPTLRTIAFHALAGAALGLCVGVLMGMTTAPVVGTVVGALAALFATVFGVKLEDLTAFARIGGFGAFCVLGVLLGITLRTHNSLGISVGQQVDEWVAAGFDAGTARQIVLYRTLGVVEDSAGRLGQTARAAKIDDQSARILSSTLSSRHDEQCPQMAPSRFENDPAKILRSYHNTGGDWDALARAVDAAPAPQRPALLDAAWRLACADR
jgi:hypothetical protein